MAGHSRTSGQTNIDTSHLAVVVPVKTFDRAKGRLDPALSPIQRSRLARHSAERVLAAAEPVDTFVVCDDPTVADWARRLGADVLTPPGPGLNPAVEFGLAQLRRLGYRTAVVSHADLPLARQLTWVADFPGVTIVTDRHGEGTNVLAVPLGADFKVGYGPGSARRHRYEALRNRLAVRWISDAALGLDIDTPADLELLADDVRSAILGSGDDADSEL